MASTILRILWFCIVGWWFGLLWFSASVLLMISVLFFPLGAYCAAKTWTVMTLKSNPTTVVVEAKAEAGD